MDAATLFSRPVSAFCSLFVSLRALTRQWTWIRKLVPLLVCSLMIAGCDERDDPIQIAWPVPAETPNHFIQMLNTQAPLAAGDYQLVVATASAGEEGFYTLTITYDNGAQVKQVGRWANSGGAVADCGLNPCYAIELARAGGIRILLESDVDSYLFLKRGDHLVAEDDNSGGGVNALIDLPLSQTNSEQYADAYFRAVDPNNERRTLEDWKRKNGFDQGYDVHVKFRDTKDLGYGRDMYARKNSDGTLAVFVNNYLVQVIPGDSNNYGPLNLEAMIFEERKHIIGTNAIEFSPIDENDPASDRIAKFFTYRPPNSPEGQVLAYSANLDARGSRFMPQICLTCHGARLWPLDENGNFQIQSLKSAKLNQLEVNTFDFSQLPGWRLEDQQDNLRQLNEWISETFSAIGTRDINIADGSIDDNTAKWRHDFALEISRGRYDNDFSMGNFNEDFIPAGWQQTADRPEGVELLYKNVVEPHCIACHSLRGTVAGENQNPADPPKNAINFETYEKFISYSDLITEYVYRRGVMPLSLLNYKTFWENPAGPPALLASFLPGFDLYDNQGNVREPGFPFARPGPDRTMVSPAQLDGSASLFARSFQWQVISYPPSATFTLEGADTARPRLVTDTDGDYVISLVVSNLLGSSDPETATITIDSTLSPSQTEVTFADHVQPILQSRCVTCHKDSPDPAYAGIPVSYENTNANVYRDVMARVNLAEPINSLLLVKPSRQNHGGGVRLSRDEPTHQTDFNTIYNWISEGAVCGTGPMCN